MTGVNENQGLWKHDIASSFSPTADIVITPGDCLDTLKTLPDEFAKLIITSPPYNIGKAYERTTALDQYLDMLGPVIEQVIRVLSPQGSADSNGVEKHGGESLRLAAQYSFKNGLDEITQRYSHLLAEVKDAIRVVDASQTRTKLSKEKSKIGRTLYSPVALNKAFQR